MRNTNSNRLWLQFSLSVMTFSGWRAILYFLLLGSSGVCIAASLEKIFTHSINTIFLNFFPFYGFVLGSGLFFAAVAMQLNACKRYVERIILLSKPVSNDASSTGDLNGKIEALNLNHPKLEGKVEDEDEDEDEDDDGNRDRMNQNSFNKGFFLGLLKLSKISFDVFEGSAIILFVIVYSIYTGISYHFVALLASLTPLIVIQYFISRSFKENELQSIRKPIEESLNRRIYRYRLTSLGLVNLLATLSLVSVCLSFLEFDKVQVSKLFFMTTVMLIALRKLTSSMFSWMRISHRTFNNETYLLWLESRKI